MNTDPTLVATAFALLLLVGLPLLAAWDARRGVDLEMAAGHRRALYASVALSLTVMTSVTLAVMAWQRIAAADLGWRVADPIEACIWGAAISVIGLAVVWLMTTLARLAGLEESPLAMILMPRTPGEKRGFLILSGVAAVGEELVFRGFLLGTLTAWTSSPWFAAVVVSLSFGLAHGYQKLSGILRSGTMGMLLAVPTVVTGSLFPAILAHFWINAAIGLGGWRYLLDDEFDDHTNRPADSGDR
ncbi:MAG: CPBP family intramembrane glutamic endopeptidase [Gemmatimonadota bacterium]|nr:CPBP family intramembrane glutamic endopeptidase [Gemmatimonadota bacterium]